MSSYILPFRSWIAIVVLVVAIEVALYACFKPSPHDRTNFLQFSFHKDELPQRLFTFHKLTSFGESSPTIVQVGDSSGFHGIDPRAVMKRLPTGTDYLNMSCCANLGFNGYYNILRYMAERNESIRYFVLHITPYTMPKPGLWDGDGAGFWQDAAIKVFGDEIHKEFLSAWRILHLPSMAFRRSVTDRAFYFNGVFKQLERPLANNADYKSFLSSYREMLGFYPETDKRYAVPATECGVDESEFFDVRNMRWKAYTEEVLDAHAALTRNFNATLIVVFQPVACVLGSGKGTERTREAIERFQRNNPDVEIPFPFIETWPSELFSVPAHIKTEHTDLLADRLGRALRDIVMRRESHARAAAPGLSHE